MKKLILPAGLLVLFFIFASLLLNIPESLPEGTTMPKEVREILAEENVDKAIIYSDFRNGWYFFSNFLTFGILASVLLLGFSAKIRMKAESLAQKVTSLPNAPMLCAGLAAFLALLVTFLSATPDQPVSAGTLGLVLAWGLVGMFIGKSVKFAVSSFYILGLFVVLDLINFPFAYYSGFVVEHHFELSRETFGKWFADLLKGNLIGYLLGVLLWPLAYWAIRKAPRSWWAGVAGGSVPIIIIILVIGPVYIDPLFNKYEPLKDDALRTRILSMAEEVGISGSQVFQVDKSKETEKINAYVTGMFGSKRIVMWDTILAKLESDEVAFVMGHEMGHYVLNHVWMFIGVFSVMLFALLFIISRTIGLVLRKFGDRMGFHELSDIASLPLILLLFGVLTFLITPALSGFGRIIEHRADKFGLDITQDGETAVSAFVKLANENLNNPSPHPFIEFWLYDHPTLANRIAFCRQYTKDETTEPQKEKEEFTTKE